MQDIEPKLIFSLEPDSQWFDLGEINLTFRVIVDVFQWQVIFHSTFFFFLIMQKEKQILGAFGILSVLARKLSMFVFVKIVLRQGSSYFLITNSSVKQQSSKEHGNGIKIDTSPVQENWEHRNKPKHIWTSNIFDKEAKNT